MRGTLIAGALLAVTASAATPAHTAGYWRVTDAASARLLAAHNRERARVGVAPLRWDPMLAAAAASYGPTLARLGGLRHSSKAARQGPARKPLDGNARRLLARADGRQLDFRARLLSPWDCFPDVSRTGRWSDVAHYTQVIWRGTTHVGCAIHPSRNYDFSDLPLFAARQRARKPRDLIRA